MITLDHIFRIFNKRVDRVFIRQIGENLYKVLPQGRVMIFKTFYTGLTSCSTALVVFKALTSQEINFNVATSLGNPINFKDFHRSLGLAINSVIYFPKILSFY